MMLRLLFVGSARDAEVVAEQLRRDAFDLEYTVAGDRASLTHKLQDEPWNAVIVDESIEGWSGLDALSAVRDVDATLPFVMLVDETPDGSRPESIRDGATDYVFKDRLGRLGATLRREIREAATRRERSHLFEELRHNKERFRRTFEKAPIGIANVGANARFTSVNERFCAITGYTRRELVGRRFSEIIHPDELGDAEARHAAFVEGVRSTMELDRRFVHKDGRTVWVRITLTPIFDGTELEQIIALVHDITQQRVATERVALQARLLDSVEQAVAATDLDNRITYWNRHAESLYGWRASEVRGKSIVDVTTPAFIRPLAEESLAQIRAGESWIGEMVMQRRDGATFPAWVVAAPILDDQEAVVGTVAVSHDISKIKSAEQELRAHKEQLAEAQRIAKVGSWQYVLATGAQAWSDEMSRMFGLAPGTVLSVEEMRAMIDPADRDRITALVRHALANAVPVEADCRITLPNGDVRTLHASARVMADVHGVAQEVITVAQDVTDARRAEEGVRRYAIQQSSIATLSHLALSGASLDELFQEATRYCVEVLHLDLCEVTKTGTERLIMVAGLGWRPGTVGEEREAGEGSLAAITLRDRMPVITRDVASDARFNAARLLVSHAARGSATVPIGAGGEPWGFIGAYVTTERTFAHSEIEFLRTIATILGQSVERVRADVELRIRAAQQSAIAELGQLAFSGVKQSTLDRACELAQNGLGVEHVLLHERLEGTLTVRAGRLWHPDLRLMTSIGVDSQSGATAVTRRPVVVKDYEREERFEQRVRDTAAKAGIRSGISVPLAGSHTFFGVLSAYSGSARSYTEADVHFMQSLANTLAEALEREKATEALMTSEQRYRSVVEGASEIIFDVDRDGVICAINRAFETVTGHSRSGFIGTPFEAFFEGPARALAAEMYQQLKTERKTVTWEAQTRRSNGTRMVLDVTSIPKVEAGEVTSMHVFARDITEARRVDQERQQLTSSLQLLLESTAEGIVAVDRRGRCQLVNRSAARMLGTSVEEVIGEDMHALCHSRYADGTPRPVSECRIMEVLTAGATFVVADDTFWRMDNTPFPVEYSAAPLIDNGQTVGVVITFSDISERRKLEAKLEQANRLSSLGRLAATIAHEFNNVLMGIAPFVEVIRRTTARDRIDASLGQIALSVTRGKRITSEILRFTQPAEPSRARVEVSEWLRAVTVEAHTLMPKSCELDVASEAGLAIDGDVNQLHQMLTNLILNARDAMPGGGRLTIRATREPATAKFAFGTVDRPDRFIHLTVEDNGTGMSAETRRHIFEPLFTTKRSGTGLGLPLAHQIVARHGGEIFVESTIGKGTVFHIFLPATDEPAVVVDEPKVEEQKPEQALRRRVLLVEDDAAVAAGIVSLLELEGLAVDIVDTGADAIDAIRHNTPDVVVLDVGLPDMEGPAVYDAIAETHPDLPVIFSTGHADASQLEQYLSKPTVSYLLKPYDAAALLAAIDEVA